MKLLKKPSEILLNIIGETYMSKIAKDSKSGICTVRKSIGLFEKERLINPINREHREGREHFITLTEKGIKTQGEILALKSIGVE